jgi:hypothetical protein
MWEGCEEPKSTSGAVASYTLNDIDTFIYIHKKPFSVSSGI